MKQSSQVFIDTLRWLTFSLRLIATGLNKLVWVFVKLYTSHMPTFYISTLGNHRNNNKTSFICFCCWRFVAGRSPALLFLAHHVTTWDCCDLVRILPSDVTDHTSGRPWLSEVGAPSSCCWDWRDKTNSKQLIGKSFFFNKNFFRQKILWTKFFFDNFFFQ